MRTALKNEALKKKRKFQSYSNSADLQKELTTRCTPIERDIAAAYEKTFCSSGCPNNIGAYRLALGELHEAARRRLKDGYARDLRACLTEVMVLDRDRSSCGMSVMLRMVPEAKNTEWAVIWAASALASGRGVPESRNDAVRTLNELINPSASEKFKAFVLGLAMSLSK